MNAHWHIGCSGFHYKHWKGIFYPEGLAQRKWFAFYCQHFSTLELNVTFYRFPQVSFLRTWYDDSPDDFRFASKVPRAITHFKKLKNSVDMLADYYGTVREGLGAKLGCVLFQFPPNIHYSEGFLERVLDNLDPSFQNVVEFRHASWWDPQVYARLAEKNISFCGMSHPALPKNIIVNTPTVYYRFHGDEQLYASLYSQADLQQAVNEIADPAKQVNEAFVFFNNDIHGYAVRNAGEMAGMVGGEARPDSAISV